VGALEHARPQRALLGGHERAGRRQPGAILFDDRAVPAVSVKHDLEFYEEGRGRGLRRGSFSVLDAEDRRWSYRFEDLGWVYCHGGGYFGGFDDGFDQGVYLGEYHVEGKIWDVSHPTRVVGPDGASFAFAAAWAENFVRLTGSDGETDLAHFECGVRR
jgi:hypothetical protein